MNQIDINTITNQSFTAEPVSQDIQNLSNISNIPTSQSSEEDHAVQQISATTELPSTALQNFLQTQWVY